MTQWKTFPLTEVATIERSAVQPEDIKTGTAYLGLEHIESGGKILGAKPVDEGELASSKFKFTDRHLLYGKLRPYLAKIACPDFSGICSTDILPVLPGPNLDRSFLCHFLRQPKMVDYASSITAGANLPRLSPSVLAQFQIPFPPLDEQRRIAAILDKADAIRRKRQEAIRLAEEFLRSTFLEVFGDPVKNPKGWEVEPLEKLVNFATGKLDSNAAVSGGAYPFFTCARENFQIDSYAFDCEALLLAGNNASADYSVKHYKGKFNAYQRTYVITLARPDLTYRYMQYALEMKLQDMKRLSKGTNTKYLTLGILNQLQFQVPDKALQIKFESIKDSVTSHMVKQNESLTLSNKSFESCVHRAFRGEL